MAHTALEGSPSGAQKMQESRGYQKEMLEESLKKNIVVAVQRHPHHKGR